VLHIKKNVDDIRESPALKFINILEKKKITVDYHDPYIPILKSRNLKNEYKSVSLQKINKYDVVYLLTNHDNLNLNYIKKNSKLIVDTRNMFKKNYKNILKL
jgi:UDP-N-acetyl-D-glucosamine dehydrogenase